ncbi:hypothetical protein QQP08_003664, partial [Theobroma cacao]
MVICGNSLKLIGIRYTDFSRALSAHATANVRLWDALQAIPTRISNISSSSTFLLLTPFKVLSILPKLL